MADARVSVLVDIRSRLAELDRATAGFQTLVRRVLAATAAYVSLRSVVRGSRDILSFGADLDHMSQRTGVAVGDLSVLRQAFKDNGVEPQRAGKAVNDMQRRIADAARGISTGRQALRDLNIEVGELSAMAPADQFQLLSERIAGIENPAQRSNAAIQLFGQSGAELLPLFQSGGAFDNARESLGRLPEVMERNAAQFERIDTLLGRLPNKSRQLFAGLGDQLASYLTEPLEALDRIDLTATGQRIGAFIAAGLEAFRDGTFAQFIGLAIEAGFEQGTAAARRHIDNALGWLGAEGGGWKVVLNGVMTFGTRTATTLIDAFTTPITYLSTGFRLLGEVSRVTFQTAANHTARAFGAVLNAITRGFEALLNGVTERVNRITAALPFTSGTNIRAASFGTVEWGTGDVRPMRGFADLLAEQREGLEFVGGYVKNTLNANLEQSRDILGLGADETERTLSASERLNELIRERIALREGEAAPARQAGAIPATPGPETFADRSRERFDDYLAGEGDFGVDVWTAAKAAMMDYVTTAGTVAQQVHASLGQIANSFTAGISQSITGLINQTMSWGEALRNIGVTVANSVVTAFSDMVAQFIVKRTMLFLFNRQMDAADVTANVTKNAAIVTSEATAATATAAAWTPAALVKSIATFGVAAIIGLALLAAALASFDTGGYTGSGGRTEPAGIVHRGEFVFPADVVAKRGPGYFYGLMDRLRFDSPEANLTGYLSGGFVGADPPAASGLGSSSDGNETSSRPIRIVVVDNRKEGERLRADPDFENYVVDVLRRNRGEVL
ncbi:MAG: hypothetical protein JJU00_19125 [Opitutales bacterium]|nr:hypothetical protein [Opitutales bacterium]